MNLVFYCCLFWLPPRIRSFQNRPIYHKNLHISSQLNLEHHNCSKFITSNPQTSYKHLKKTKIKCHVATQNSLHHIVVIVATAESSHVWVQESIDEFVSCPAAMMGA
jgi:hypothetical protein